MMTSAATKVLSILTGLALVVLGILAFPTVGTAEDFEAMHCFAGTSTAFQGGQELKPVVNYAHNGILRGPSKLFNNVGTHCAGTQRDVGPPREGYILCKVVDADGDIIITGGPYAGLKNKFPFLEGTGKWKGITGDYESDQFATAAKPAVPGSYHICAQWKGKFEVRK
jgi:hypothetical protein